MIRPFAIRSVGRAAARLCLTGAVAVLLSGCLGGLQPPGFRNFGKAQGAEDTALHGAGAAESGTASVAVIDALRARRSVLPAGGAYAQVAGAVLSAGSGASAAGLRMARLQAEAVDKNWLPQIGPVVTLDSLGVLAAQIVAEQALIDNGRRRAEREMAAADVQVAAVTLAEDLNDRVRQGLALYVQAQQAQAQAAVASRGVERLSAYQDMVQERVDGGLSDRSELMIVAQKRSEMQATYAADMQAAGRAWDDLAMLAGRPLAALRGIEGLALPDAPALSVLRAEAEGARALAAARVERAGALPGLVATAAADGDGLRPGLRLGGVSFGFGTGAKLRALAATPDLVARQRAEAAQGAAQQAGRLTGEIAALRLRMGQGAAVLAQTKGNLDLFVEQYRAGLRSLVELVGQYDAATRLERDQAALEYEIARREVELAALRGLLVDGAPM